MRSPGSGNENYANWRVGIFIHDADPRGGALSHILFVLVRDANSCNPDEVAACAGRQIVTFGNDRQDAMRGIWPIKVKDHSIGYFLKFNKGIKRTA